MQASLPAVRLHAVAAPGNGRRAARKERLSMRSRPVGLSVIAVVAAVLGIFALVGAAAWWGVSDTVWFLPRLRGIERFVALLLLIVGCLELILAWGLWSLRSWAWPLGVGLSIAAICVALIQVGHGIPGSHLVAIVLAAITLCYLFTPRVREVLRA
jgi:uncharacterized membrane protein (DUF2068 family)